MKFHLKLPAQSEPHKMGSLFCSWMVGYRTLQGFWLILIDQKLKVLRLVLETPGLVNIKMPFIYPSTVLPTRKVVQLGLYIWSTKLWLWATSYKRYWIRENKACLLKKESTKLVALSGKKCYFTCPLFTWGKLCFTIFVTLQVFFACLSLLFIRLKICSCSTFYQSWAHGPSLDSSFSMYLLNWNVWYCMQYCSYHLVSASYNRRRVTFLSCWPHCS